MYTRSFSTLGCAEFSLEEVIALGRRHQITDFELRALAGTIDLPAYFAANFHTPADLAARLTEMGGRVIALDTSFRLIDSAEPERSKLLEFLPWAEALGVRWLRVFDGGKALDSAALARAAETIAWWQGIRRDRNLNVDLMIETHDVLLDAEEISGFAAAMPRGSVRLLWDAHHTWKKGGEDPVTTWRAIKSHVVHVHVKDSISRESGRHPYTYVLPGTGEFPMAGLRKTLDAEFSGTLSLEWERLWHPYLPPLEDALEFAARRHWW